LGRLHCLVLLLVLAVAASGLQHVASGSHQAFAASQSHFPASVSQVADGEPHQSHHEGEPHGTVCSMTGGCSFYMPVTLSTVLARTDGGPAYFEPDAGHSGRVPSPQSRPPKLFANV
jgi:hypothetical protein